MASTIQKTTLKKYNGTNWDSIHLATSGDITMVGEQIEVMGSNIGALKVGDVINASDSITDTLKKMLQTRIPATYAAPSVSLNTAAASSGAVHAAGTYEAGTAINALLTAAFTKADAGDLTTLKITKSGTEVVSGATSPQTYNYNETLGDGTVSLVATAEYTAGAVKNDNLGDPSPSGSIPAGSKNATRAYTGIRKGFYGPDSAGAAEAINTSAGIRALTATSGAVSKGTKLAISVPAGSTRCTIAFRATVGSLAQVLYRESGNANITAQFTKTTVAVEGANGYTAVDYNVYTVTWAQPTAGAMTFDVTI